MIRQLQTIEALKRFALGETDHLVIPVNEDTKPVLEHLLGAVHKKVQEKTIVDAGRAS